MRLSWLVTVLLLSSCGLFTTRQETYLEQATGKATQKEIEQEFGEPVAVQALDNGETVWVFRYTGVSSPMLLDVDLYEVWCVEYVLTFDAEKILRHWVRRDCPRK